MGLVFPVMGIVRSFWVGLGVISLLELVFLSASGDEILEFCSHEKYSWASEACVAYSCRFPFFFLLMVYRFSRNMSLLEVCNSDLR